MPGKLLLADDSVTVQRVIELTFADQGMQVISVGDGARAIERAEQERPDIILADVSMPERDGYEVTRYVKRTPHLSSVPVILMTGAFEQLDEERAREVGCDAVLAKPFEPHMVISLVRQLLAQGGQASAESSTSTSIAPAPTQASEPFSSSTGSLDAYLEQLDDALSAATAGGRAPQPVETTPNVQAERAATGEEEVPSLSDAFSALLADELGESPLPAAWGALAGSQSRAAGRRGSAGASTLDATPPITEEFLDEVARRIGDRLTAASHAAQPAPPAPAAGPATPQVTPALLDAVAAKVIERIPEDTIRDLVNQRVLDIAERLVREEIEKIKAEARP